MSRMCRWVLTLALVATAGLAAPSAVATPLPGGVTTESPVPLMWAGQVWGAKSSPLFPSQPAPNYWLASPLTTFVDNQQRLHLVARQIQGNWYCAGVSTLKDDFGYGTYRFVVDTPLSAFDANAVVGMFTYNDNPANGHQEVDVELSRWSIPDDGAPNAQYVVQPWKEANHLLRFNAPTDIAMTYQFTWKPSGVVFRIFGGTTSNAPLVKKWRTK